MDSKVCSERLATAVVGLVAAQARDADLTRTVSRDVVQAIKDSGLLALSATDELGGTSGTVADVAAELEVLVTACAFVMI
jgi:alkylation response protein AidB-like acyl-CoA dehydrogenase